MHVCIMEFAEFYSLHVCMQAAIAVVVGLVTTKIKRDRVKRKTDRQTD